MYAGEVGSGDRPGYYNIKFGSEASADTSQNGFGVSKKDEGSVGGSLIGLQHCKPDPTSFFYPRVGELIKEDKSLDDFINKS